MKAKSDMYNVHKEISKEMKGSGSCSSLSGDYGLIITKKIF